MIVVAAGLSIFLAMAMASSFVRKLRGDAASEHLRGQLRVAALHWRAVGALELCASVGLLVGLVVGPLGVAAAMGIALLMLGAVVLHLRAQVVGLALVAPLVVLVLGTSTAAARLATL